MMSHAGSTDAAAETVWNAYSASIQARARQILTQGGTVSQALLAALLTETVRQYRRRAVKRLGPRAGLWLLAVPVSTGVGFAIIAATGWLLVAVGVSQSDSVLLGLALLLALVALATRIGVSSSRVDLVGQSPILRFRLGRCESATDVRRLGRCLAMIAGVFGLQAGLLYSADIGWQTRFGIGDALLLTLDNLLHGVLFDVCELYDIHFGPVAEHTAGTATVFLVFRIIFDLLVGVAAYLWYRGREVQQLLADCPVDSLSRDHLCRWIDDVMRDKANWPRRFSAECVFLQMVRLFLEDRPAEALELPEFLSALQIAPRVQELFGRSVGQTK